MEDSSTPKPTHHQKVPGNYILSTRLMFDLDLPFTPSVYDVIYVEKDYNPTINKYILKHYDKLCEWCAEKHLQFCYLPKIKEQSISNETLQYMFPYLKPNHPFTKKDISVELMEQHLISGAIEGPALIHFIQMEEEGEHEYYLFTYHSLKAENPLALKKEFKEYLENVTLIYRGELVFYSLVKPTGDEVADHGFHETDNDLYRNMSDYDLEEEIRNRIKELRRRGVQMSVLRGLVEEQPTLSRLIIDKNHRIFLPDYNNMEITMPPLPKAVFLLFLKHPEGIAFKQLREYRKELLNIYKQISNRVVERNIEESIRDITDPTKNSINEKCARIREAFVKQFDIIYAHHYFITGKRGEPKKIILPRELVEWKEE